MSAEKDFDWRKVTATLVVAIAMLWALVLAMGIVGYGIYFACHRCGAVGFLSLVAVVVLAMIYLAAAQFYEHFRERSGGVKQ